MPEPDAPRAAASGVGLEEVLETLVEEVVSDYRVDRHRARDLIEDDLEADRKLTEAMEGAADFRRLARTRAYRDARKKAKKSVYYALRQYKADGDLMSALVEGMEGASGAAVASTAVEIAGLHASTRERLDALGAFHDWLLPHLDGVALLADVGCGVYPLLFPFDRLPALELLVAAERDETSVAALDAWAVARPEPRLRPLRWSLEEGWEPLLDQAGGARFDVALLLKLVPVVERQQPELLATLAETPAERLVVSGSRRSLTKRQSIERRERASLRRFQEAAGRAVVDEWTSEDEIVQVWR